MDPETFMADVEFGRLLHDQFPTTMQVSDLEGKYQNGAIFVLILHTKFVQSVLFYETLWN